MLLVPFLAGVIRSQGAWLHLPLLAFWLSGYFAFNAATLWIKARFKPRYRTPVLVYGAVSTVLGVLLAALRPDLLWWAPALVACLTVSLTYSWRRRERAMVNDVVTILAACLFGLVTYQAGYSPGGTILAGWRAMGAITALTFLYFVGTALYVKTMIRERGKRSWTVASVGYHALVTLAAAAAVTLPSLPPGIPHRPVLAVAVLFAVLTARAGVMAGRAVRPLHVGLGEIVACLALLTIVWFWR